LRFAIETHRGFDRYCEDNPDEPIRIRIGLHFGEAIAQEDDFYGSTVNVAARTMGAGNGGEILVSTSLRDIVHGKGDFNFDDGGEVILKGLGKHVVYRLSWRDHPLACPRC
jgi:class 3 adenylate cyclase